MLNVIFTLDYEIHGNGEGSPLELMVQPTDRLLRLFDEYGAKLTIMADVAEILKFKEYAEEFGRDDYHYHKIVEQLRDAVRGGHDVQLHLHASYFNARFRSNRWQQDWSEYDFAGLSGTRLDEILKLGKDFLESLLRPIRPDYACTVFRAANWSVSPSSRVVRALVDNGFKIDTSVFKYGRREGIVNFDYSNAWSELVPWPVDQDDICQRNEASRLLEVPIYCERRWIGAFLTLSRIYRATMSWAHPVTDMASPGPSRSPGRRGMLSRVRGLAQRHAWKADFNQCTSRQLIKALDRAAHRYQHRGGEVLPFVLIGHSKLFTYANEGHIRRLCEHIRRHRSLFEFGTFESCNDVQRSPALSERATK
jgi:hypothetical protein